MKDAKDWLSALLSETVPACVALLSFASTVLTYFPALGIYRYRWIPIICLIFAFGWANFRVYKKLRNETAKLQAETQESRKRKAELILRPRGKSWFIMVRKTPQFSDPCSSVYLDLDCDIENKGNRISNIDQFEIQIDGFAQPFTGLKPEYPNTIFARNSVHPRPGTGLGKDGYFAVGAEAMIPAKLGFLLPYLPPGYAATGANQQLGPLYCTLKITDTQGASASCRLTLIEHR